LQIGIACVVAYASRVLTTVGFHNEHVFESDEISDPSSDRHLSAKLRTSELTRTEQLPEPMLRIR
jgi:hypothetical protein